MSDITEKTKVNVSITSWWHLIILVITIVWGVATLKFSQDRIAEIAKQSLEQSRMNSDSIILIETDLKLFHQKYELDVRYHKHK